jgi:hypothetical protein
MRRRVQNRNNIILCRFPASLMLCLCIQCRRRRRSVYITYRRHNHILGLISTRVSTMPTRAILCLQHNMYNILCVKCFNFFVLFFFHTIVYSLFPINFWIREVLIQNYNRVTTADELLDRDGLFVPKRWFTSLYSFIKFI